MPVLRLRNTIDKRVVVPFLAALLLGSVRGSSPGEAVRVVLSSRKDAPTAETVFVCAGRIYAHVSFPADFSGKHRVEGLWQRPDGYLQERTRLAVDFPARGEKKARLWLEFDDEKSIFAEPRFKGPGRARSPHHGLWTLKVLADGAEQAKAAFRVECWE